MCVASNFFRKCQTMKLIQEIGLPRIPSTKVKRAQKNKMKSLDKKINQEETFNDNITEKNVVK